MQSFVPPPGAYLIFELEPEATLELHCDVTDETAIEEVRKLTFKKYVGYTVKIIDDPPRPARNYNRVSICPINWAMDSDSTSGDSISECPALRPISVRVSTELREYGLDEAPVPRVSLDSEMTAYSESDLEGRKEEKAPFLEEPEPDAEDWNDEKGHHSTSTLASTILEKPCMIITHVARDTTPEEDLEFTPIIRVSSEYTAEGTQSDATELYEEYTALQRIVEAANQRRREASSQFARDHGMFEDITGCVEMSTGCFDFLNRESWIVVTQSWGPAEPDSAFSLVEKRGDSFRDSRTKMRSQTALGDDNKKSSKKRTIWKLIKTRLKPQLMLASSPSPSKKQNLEKDAHLLFF
ncbi:hypothetical protein C8J56DRAFT_970146 [Mycena floridula]|nr:hypothetical protein C8J56DRAFT_970146 [Mycena floridula]